MYPKFQQVILWVILLWGLFLLFWCFFLISGVGDKNKKNPWNVNMIPVLCRWPSFLANVCMVCALAFWLYSVCVNSGFCGQVNCFAVLDQIPTCPLKLLLQICCEWSCKQVVLCKLTGWVCSSQGAWVLTAYPVLLCILNNIFFPSY